MDWLADNIVAIGGGLITLAAVLVSWVSLRRADSLNAEALLKAQQVRDEDWAKWRAVVDEKLAQNTVDHNRMGDEIHALRNDFNGLRQEMNGFRQEMTGLRQEMNANFIAINNKLFEIASGRTADPESDDPSESE